MGRFLAAAVLALALGVVTWKLTAPAPVPPGEVTEAGQPSAPAEAPRPQVTAAATGTSSSTGMAATTAPGADPRAAAAPATKEARFQEFAEKAEALQASLPTLSQMKALEPGEVHGTPAAVMEAGARIGELAEAIEKDASLAPAGLAFYARCARRDDLSTPVRALCLSDQRELARKTGAAPASEKGIPPTVIRLADKLKDSH